MRAQAGSTSERRLNRHKDDGRAERLKEQVSLVSLVQAHGVELRKAGADLVGRCPFHDDRTWSTSPIPTGFASS